jgi:hypothetical protein
MLADAQPDTRSPGDTCARPTEASANQLSGRSFVRPKQLAKPRCYLQSFMPCMARWAAALDLKWPIVLN